jgi:hypothetical protein
MAHESLVQNPDCPIHRFTASVMLSQCPIHEIQTSVLPTYGFLLLNLNCPIHKIHSIFHAGSWISAKIFVLPCSRNSQHLTLYTDISMRFSASVMLAHDSPLLFSTLPYPRDSQHLSCWLKKSLPLFLHYPIHEIHSICHAGSWIPATKTYSAIFTGFSASVLLVHESLLQNLLFPIHRIPSICHASSWIFAAAFALP